MPDRTGMFATQGGETGYRVVIRAAPGHLLLGGVRVHEAGPFLKRADAVAFGKQSREVNQDSGRKVASVKIKKVRIRARNPKPGARVSLTVRDLKRIYQAGKRKARVNVKVRGVGSTTRKPKRRAAAKRKTSRRRAARRR